MNVRIAFSRLLYSLKPSDSEAASAERHVTVIRARLRAGFKLKGLFRVGSASRGTFIRGRSDVDVFALVSRDDVRWGDQYIRSDRVLENLRAELMGRFPNTDVYRDVQAIVVPFADVNVDVVPAFFSRAGGNGWPIYSMPDGAGGWMPTNPTHHNAYIKRENIATTGKLTRTAQLMKFWRDCRTPRVPISSFHIETVLAQSQICRGPKSYPQCLGELFRLLDHRECRALLDPVGISGYIPAAKTGKQRETVLTSVHDSRYHADAALRTEAAGDAAEATRQWSIVFNHKVPHFKA